LRLGCEALEPLLLNQTSTLDAPSLVASLGASRERLRAAVARLRSAQRQLAAVDERALDDSTHKLYLALRDRLPSVTARLSLLSGLPGLLGHDAPSTILILGQNADELRATGGFIGSAGALTFQEGRLIRREYGSSYFFNVPPDRLVPPPEPLRRHMNAAYWHLREANWWPDFPTAAMQSRYFYEVVREQPLAAVAAIDQEAVAMLLEVTGPLALPEYGEAVSHENVRERMDYYVHVVAGPTEEARMRFLSTLNSTLLEHLEALPRDRLPKLAAVLERALASQHLQLWAADETTQQAIVDLGWAGRMLETDGDYIFPVSSNVGRNKINREVEQELSYHLTEAADGRVMARATLVLRNRRPTDDPGPYPTADYRDYFRLYVPAQSELQSAIGFDEAVSSSTECGRTVFSGLVVVSPGRERRIELTYRLPASIEASSYSLLVQKQPGVPALPLRLGGFGPGRGEIRSELAGHQFFSARDGGPISASAHLPIAASSISSPACGTFKDPPRQLRPPGVLAIPRLGLRASFVELGIEPDGTMASPETGSVVGWYAQSARPGQVGNMVTSGHVDWDKRPAVFWSLRELRPGDQIEVFDDGGEVYLYEVEWSRRVDPYGTPLGGLVGPTAQRWLTLITCGGIFNPITRDYSERLIVRASLARAAS
jgi:hypothetical protein